MGEFGGAVIARVLVLEQSAAPTGLAQVLNKAGFACETVSSINAALALIDGRGVEVMICALGIDAVAGVDLVRIIHARKPDLPTIVVAEDTDVATAVAVIRHGAFDGSVLICRSRMLHVCNGHQ